MIGLSSRDVSLIDMSVLARWKIKPRLMGVPGVANVAIYGQRDRQLQVQVDPESCAASGVSLTQVIETTGNALWVSPLTFVEASTPGTGGFVESANQRLADPARPADHARREQLAAVAGRGRAGRTLRLGDVADVVEDHQPLIGDAVVDGAPSLFLVIEKFPGANTLEVTRDVEARDGGAWRRACPGITVDTSVYRPATFIETALRNARRGRAARAVLLLIALLLAVFGSWRAALISAVVRARCRSTAAAYVLYLRGTHVHHDDAARAGRGRSASWSTTWSGRRRHPRRLRGHREADRAADAPRRRSRRRACEPCAAAGASRP